MSTSSAPLPSLRRTLGASVLVLSLALVMVALMAGAGRPHDARAQEVQCSKPSAATVKPASRSPAAVTSYEVVFITGGCELAPVTDGVRMVLHEDIGVPRGINPMSVRVSYNLEVAGQSPMSGRGGASAIGLEDADDPRRPTIITVYPVIQGDRSGDRQDGAAQRIPAGSRVTIKFNAAAGFSNPTEGGAFFWTVATVHGGEATEATQAQHPGRFPDGSMEGNSEDKAVLEAFKQVEQLAEHPLDDDDYPYGLLVDWEIQLTHEEVGRGAEVTAIGRGYKNGTTLTFWRDANFDGVRDRDEDQLCQANVDGNDIGYCTFTVQKPPFVRGFGECTTKAVSATENDEEVDRRMPTDNADCNFVNAVDGLNHSSIWVGELEKASDGSTGNEVMELYRLDDLPQVLDLVGEVVAEVGADRRLTVQLVDFPQGQVVVMDIGGVPIDVESIRNPHVHSSGSLHFTVDLPGPARRGYQSLRVVVRDIDALEPVDCLEEHSDCHEISATVWVEPDAVVTSTPEVVLPNQRISLEGRGFLVDGNSGEIASINIGGHFLDLSRVNGGEGPALVDRHGSWRGFVDLPINSATTSPGTRELRVVDSQGRGGTVEVTIPPRVLTATPIWGRPGNLVTVSGSGFPGRNHYGSSVNLRIFYDTEESYFVGSAEGDVSGNFSVEVRIPRRVPAPSSNFIRVEFEDDDEIEVVTTTAHEVPGATVELNPTFGPPGTVVSLAGEGFLPYAKVNSVMVGDLDVTPGGSVTTDAHGRFALEFLAPGTGVGTQTVSVSLAGVTASAPFDIALSGVVPGSRTPVVEALEVLGDSFIRAFHFNNDTKAWALYDPLAGEFNDLEYLVAGETYLVLVDKTVEAILNGDTRRLTCVNDNCWNQIIW